MRRNFTHFYLAGVVSLLLFLSACAPVTLEGTWKDASYTPRQIDNVLVIGVTKNDLNRRLFEDHFVAALDQLGVKAQVSYPVVTCDKVCSKKEITNELKDKGMNGILITRVVNSREETETTPERVIVEPDPFGDGYSYGYYRPHLYYRDWYPYYSRSVEVTRFPAEVTQVRVLTLETNLYTKSPEKLVWSAQSEVEANSITPDLIDDYIKVMIKAMERDKIF